MGRHRKRQKVGVTPPAQKDLGGLWMGGSTQMGYAGIAGRNRNLTTTPWGAATAYQIVPEVSRAQNIRADAIGSLPWHIVRPVEGKPDEVIAKSDDSYPKHPLAKALQNVVQYNNKSLISLMEYSDTMTGEIYIQKTFDERQGKGLYWMNPLGAMPFIVAGEITHYQYTQQYGGGTQDLKPYEVAYYHNFNPYNDFRGWGKTQAVMQKVNIARNLDDFIEDFFANNARPSVIVNPTGDEPFTTAQMNQLQQQLDVYLKGRGNQWATYVSKINAKFTPLEQPQIGQQYTIAKEITHYIYTQFGVPLAMAGDDSGTQYKTGDDVKVAFFQLSIIPQATHIERFINASIMPYFDQSGVFFRFDTSEFDLVSSDDDLRSQIADRNVRGAIWTRNQALKYVKAEHIPDMDFMFMDGVLVPLSDVPTYWQQKLLIRPTPVSADVMLGSQNIHTEPPATAGAPQAANGAGASNTPAQLPAGKTLDGAVDQSAFVYLPLDNNAQLMAIQNELRKALGSDSITYQDPATFHVTLLYCKNISDHDLGEIAEATMNSVFLNKGAFFDSFPITGSKFGIFDNTDEHALYLAVDGNPALAGLQKTLYGYFDKAGHKGEVSPFSAPDQYTPHITLAYLPAHLLPKLEINFKAVADKFIFGRDEYKPFATIQAAVSTIPGKAIQTDAESELKAWERKASVNGKWKAAFETVHLSTGLRAWLRHSIDHSEGDKDALKAAFAIARDVLAESGQWSDERLNLLASATRSIKSYEDTEADFENSIMAIIGSAQQDEVSRAKFGGQMRRICRLSGLQAFRDGLNDGGVDPESLSPEQLAIFRDWQDETSGYISDFGSEIFHVGITPDDVRLRTDYWSNKTLTDIYYRGLVQAAPYKLYRWQYGDTDHCQTCKDNNGQVKSLKDWQTQGMPQSSQLTCKGFNCACELLPT